MIALSFAAVAVATLMGWHVGFTRGVRVGKALERDDAHSTCCGHLTLDASDALWQSIQDRLVVDSLVGASTYGEDK